MESHAALAHFTCAGGSVVGRDHVRRNRNNQDGLAIVRGAERIAAVVTDGCGEASRSEIGACLGAAFLAHWLAQAGPAAPEALATDACAALERYLRELCRGPWGEGRARDFLAEHLLFSFLAAVIAPDRSFVFGIGDGVIWADGRTIALDPGPENAPSYLGYRLVESFDAEADGESTSHARGLARRAPVAMHLDLPTRELEALLIASDGLLPLTDGRLEALARDPATAKNPTLLQRRLVAWRDHDRAFQDDATAALLVRTGEG